MSESVAGEHHYICLSEFPTTEATTTMSDKTKTSDDDGLNYKATELRLGYQVPSHRSEQTNVSCLSRTHVLCQEPKECSPTRPSTSLTSGSSPPVSTTDVNSGSGPVKDHKPCVPVKVGWPPIRSFRKNTMASSQSQKQRGNNNSETEAEAKTGPEPCLYVKVSMEGAPYLRKIDLKTYKSYVELSSALEKMFSCFTLGHFGSHGGGCGRDGFNESRLTDLMCGSEYCYT